MLEIEKIENLFYIHFFLLLMILAKVKWKPLSRIQLFVTPWTIQSREFSRPEWVAFPFSRVSPQPTCQTQVSHIGYIRSASFPYKF